MSCVRAAAVLVTCATLLSGCGSAKVTATPPATETPTAAPAPSDNPAMRGQTFALFPSHVPGPGWQLTSAALLGDTATQDALDQATDILWSAEYENITDGDTDTAPYLQISGFSHQLARANLQVHDPKAVEGEIGGRQAIWGTDPDDPEGQVFVALALSHDHCVELYAFNLTVDQLKAYAATLQLADQATWSAANKTAGVGGPAG